MLVLERVRTKTRPQQGGAGSRPLLISSGPFWYHGHKQVLTHTILGRILDIK